MRVFKLLLAVVLAAGLSLATASENRHPWTKDELRVFVDRMAKSDLDAYYEIGLAMVLGDRLAQDIPGGLERLNHAADRNHLASLFALMEWHDHNGEVARATRYLQRALEAGGPPAHYQLAKLLEAGRLTGQFSDYEQRRARQVRALMDAANGGVPDAMYDLGMYYRQSNNPDQNPERALYWMEQGAARDHYHATIWLAYRLVSDAPAEWPDALKYQQTSLERVAARNPKAAAMVRFRVGEEYDSSFDLAMNTEDASQRAAFHYDRVMNDQHADAGLKYLAFLRFARLVVEHGEGEARDQAVAALEREAAKGSPHAQCYLTTEMHDEHGALPHNPERASHWEREFRKGLSLRLGLPASCKNDAACEEKFDEAAENICDEVYATQAT